MDLFTRIKGQFQLHYFLAEPSIVIQDSSEDRSASEIIKQELAGDLEISSEFRRTYCQEESRYTIIPAHRSRQKPLSKKKRSRS